MQVDRKRRLKVEYFKQMVKEKYSKARIDVDKAIRKVARKTGVDPSNMRSCSERSVFCALLFDEVRNRIKPQTSNNDLECLCH